jgi:hypothetical protein
MQYPQKSHVLTRPIPQQRSPRNTPAVSCEICRRRRRPLTSGLKPTAMHCRRLGVLQWETCTPKTQTPQTTIAKSHGVEDLWSLEGRRRCWMTAPCGAMLLSCVPRESLYGSCGALRGSWPGVAAHTSVVACNMCLDSRKHLYSVVPRVSPS